MKQLLEIFQCTNGKLSATRVGAVAWMLIPLFIWAALSIYKREMIAPPQTIVYLVGIAFTGKVTSAYVDNKTTSPAVTTTPTTPLNPYKMKKLLSSIAIATILTATIVRAQTAPSIVAGTQLAWDPTTTDTLGNPAIGPFTYNVGLTKTNVDLNISGITLAQKNAGAVTTTPITTLFTAQPNGDYILWVQTVSTNMGVSDWVGLNVTMTRKPGNPKNQRIALVATPATFIAAK